MSTNTATTESIVRARINASSSLRHHVGDALRWLAGLIDGRRSAAIEITTNYRLLPSEIERAIDDGIEVGAGRMIELVGELNTQEASEHAMRMLRPDLYESEGSKGK